MVSYLDRCAFTAVSTGTGSFVVSAATTGFRTPASAGATNATSYYYAAANAALTEWEIGTSVYTTADVTATRTVITGSNGASAVNFTSAPTVKFGCLRTAAMAFSGFPGSVGPTQGGTGLSSFTQGDLLYASAANTLAALAKSTTSTHSLTNTGASNAPAWAQVALASGVSGTLPVANGGTGDTGTAWSTTPISPSSNGGATFNTSTRNDKTIGKTTFFWAVISVSGVGTATQLNWPLSNTSAQVTPFYGVNRSTGLHANMTGNYISGGTAYSNISTLLANDYVYAGCYEVA